MSRHSIIDDSGGGGRFRVAENRGRLPGGWCRISLEAEAVPDALMPEIELTTTDGSRRISMPFTRGGRFDQLVLLPRTSLAMSLSLAPWPVTAKVRRFTIAEASLLRVRMSQIGSVLRVVLNPMVRERLAIFFRRRGQGLFALLRSLLAILAVDGVEGIRRRLSKPAQKASTGEALPGRYWYLAYRLREQDHEAPANGAGMDYVTLLASDAVAEPVCAARIVQAGLASGADLLFGDEMVEDDGDSWRLHARPPFSHDFFLSRPDLGGVVAVRPEVLRRAAPEWSGCALEVELLVRLVAASRSIAHVPDVLCRRPREPRFEPEAARGALERYTRTFTRPVILGAADASGVDVVYAPPPHWKATIVVPTRNRVELLAVCVRSLEETTPRERYDLIVMDNDSDDPETLRYLESIRDRHTVLPFQGPFNFAAVNNAGVAAAPAGNDFVVLLNNDIEAVTPGWLERIAAHVLRDDVGVVGAMLLYPDRSVQHAGVVIGLDGICDHVSKFEPGYLDTKQTLRNPGYLGSLTAVRDYSAVTAACLAARTSLYKSLGGLREDLKVGFNDIDFCLRARELGLKVLVDGRAVLIHHESASRGKFLLDPHPADTALFLRLHGAAVAAGDFWSNPLLSRHRLAPTPREGARATVALEPRTVLLPAVEDR